MHPPRVDPEADPEESAPAASRRASVRRRPAAPRRYSYAELYLHLRDRLDARVASAEDEPSPGVVWDF